MPVLPGTDKIGDWNVTMLTKWVTDWFRNHPLPPVEQLQINDLIVADSLVLPKNVSFEGYPVYTVGHVGAAQYENGWSFFGSPYTKAAYWKDPFDWVHLLGMIGGGVVGSPAFQLPPGFRPSSTPPPFAVVSNGAFGRVDVGTNGTVTPQSPSSNVSVSLAGISFPL